MTISQKAKASAKTLPAQAAKPSRKSKAVALKAPPAPKAPPVKSANNATDQVAKAKAALNKIHKSTTAEVKTAAPVKTKSRKISVSAAANEAVTALAAKWLSLFKKADQIETKPYNMKSVFAEKTAVQHKILGWGYILTNRNDRLEVLFKDGIKHLISNYKP